MQNIVHVLAVLVGTTEGQNLILIFLKEQYLRPPKCMIALPSS